MLLPQATRGFILPVMLSLLFASSTLWAESPLPLPGHDLKLDETVKHCYGALVATFEKVNSVLDPSPTPTLNFETRWKLKQMLRGEYAPEISLVIRTQYSPKSDEESLPIVNGTYILIGYGPEINHQEIAIILKNTPKNLEKVKTLLQK